ncbi:MAG: hypothetical protein JOS17DRAFT_729374 [Linnemannia elongata]|nr:MAG: hypothetical protein JOS17DRAFT_729374 [Linnemannia elongata]
MAPAIYGLRIWMALVTLANLIIVITFHAWYIPKMNKVMTERYREMYEQGVTQTDLSIDSEYEYAWDDYAVIISSVILLPAYLYSIWGKRSFVSNKYARAVLMLLPALFLIGVQLRQVDVIIRSYNRLFEGFPPELRSSPFSCSYPGHGFNATCGFGQSYMFVPVVVGFFVIIEVVVTLFRGPLHSPKEAYL